MKNTVPVRIRRSPGMSGRLGGGLLMALLSAGLFPHAAAHAQDPSAHVRLEPHDVVIGEEFRLIVEVRGASRVERVIIPELFDFAYCINPYDPAVEVKVGDAESGAAANSVSLSYVFMPTRVGFFEMRPFRITADGRSLETDAFAVRVSGGADPVVTARIEPPVVNMGDEFTLIAEVVGSESMFLEFVAPDVFDFAEAGVGGGSSSTQRWRMRALEPGEWVIPPVRVVDQDRSYESEPLSIMITDEPIEIGAEATLQSEVIWVGGEFTLRLAITGVHELDEDPAIPETDGFAELLEVERPWLFIVNTEKTTSYSYRYRAAQAGSFEIGGIRILADGREFESDPVSLVIDEAPTGEADPPDGLVLVGALGKTRAYVGEPVVVEYSVQNLGSWPSISSSAQIGTMSWPTFEDFEVLSLNARRVSVQQVQDRSFRRSFSRRMVVVPLEAGTADIGVAAVEYKVVERRDDWRRAPEDGLARDSTSYILTSEPLSLEVVPLPLEGRPASFRGHVGTLAVASRVDRNRAEVGETVTLRVKVSVTGNVDALAAPEIDFPSGVAVSEPEIVTVLPDRYDTPHGDVEYIYRLAAVNPGTYRIPAVEMSYFDPESEAYGTARGRSYTITVTASGRDAW
ncbi:MAG: protein BatD [Gemmatimonadetes bacterium]|nr:protein BatD [Gemmatimonadota bacterium]MYD14305.1 protein BatD [Gemmatimonadota bacterium]